MALDDFGDCPLIVRSSSLLEDQMGAAFSGKYKSLFLANQGSKQQRMEALMDAIAEVYASMYNPDSIQYRSERKLLDFPEEMGILIQEVVGIRVGHYFLPLYAGVAFSNNEFRWSPRIKREDGLVRLVMGLGTRAVDRVGMISLYWFLSRTARSEGEYDSRRNQTIFTYKKIDVYQSGEKYF
jgi:phosphoenolpyruvate synthase/pyruvate phosphate dikinase